MSKVGAIESAEATEKLTSTLNGYKMGVEGAMHVVDAFSAVDLAAATSVDELAEAMSRTANMANDMGVSFEKMTGYIGAVSEATRRSASTIGESFKTILSRLANVKAGKFVDEETGDNLNDIAKVLHKVGIELIDVNGHWMEADELFETLAGRWETLTELEKNAISTAIAGVRQAEIWRAFMNNFSRAQDLGQVALESNGSAAEKFSVYMESLQAKVNQFKAAWEKLIYSEGSVKLFSSVVDAGTKLMKILDSLANNSFVRLIAKIALVEGGVLGLVKAFKALMETNLVQQIRETIEKVQEASSAITETREVADDLRSSLTSVKSLMITTFVITGIMLAVEAIGYLSQANERYLESLKKSIAEREANISSYESEVEKLKNLQEALKSTNGNKEELLLLSSQIRDVLGEDISLYNDEAAAYKAVNAEIEAQIALLKEKKRIEEEGIRSDKIKQVDNNVHTTKIGPISINDDLKETADRYKAIQEGIKAVDEEIERVKEKNKNSPSGGLIGPWIDEAELKRLQANKQGMLDEAKSYQETLDEQTKNVYELLVDDLFAIATSTEAQGIGKELIKNIVYAGNANTFEEACAEFDKLKPVLEEVSSLTMEFKNNLGESGNTENLEKVLSKLNEIAEKYPDIADYINGIKDGLTSMGSAAESAGSEVVKSAEEIKKEYEQAAEAMSNVISAVADHGKAIEEVNNAVAENGYLTTDNLNSILDMYPQLTDAVAEYVMGLRDEQSIIAELNTAYQEDKDNMTRALLEKMANNVTFWQSLLASNQELVAKLKEQYAIDLTNYTTFQEFKSGMKEAMNETLKRYEEDYITYLKSKYGEDSVEFDEWNRAKETGTTEAIINMQGNWAGFFAWLLQNYGKTAQKVAGGFKFKDSEETENAKKRYEQLSEAAQKAAQDAFDAAAAMQEVDNVSFSAASAGAQNLASSLGSVTSAAKEAENAMNKLVDMVVKMLKKNAENDKKYFQKKIKDAQDNYNKQKKLLQREYQDRKKALQKEQKERKRALDDWYKARKKALEDSYKATHDALEKEKEEELDAIDDRIEAYERLINAKIKALEKDEAEHDYKREEEKKIKEIADLENKLAESRNDTSIAGIKKTLQLEEELAKKKEELAEYQHDHSVEQQKDALQDELDRYKQMLEDQKEAMEKNYDERLEAMENAHEKEMDLLEEEKEARQRALEDWYDAQTEALENWYQAEQDRLDADLERTKAHYNKQIELVDEYLSQEGLLRQQAQDMLENQAEETLKKLLEFNRVYGDGVDKTILDIWNKAMQAGAAIEGAAGAAGAAGVRAANEVRDSVAGLSVEVLNAMNSVQALQWAMENMYNNAIIGIRGLISETSELRKALDELAKAENSASKGKAWVGSANLSDWDYNNRKETGNWLGDGGYAYDGGSSSSSGILKKKTKKYHEGGFVDSSSSGGWEKEFYKDILNGVNSDEILSKLRKNELVLTRSQQKSLLDVVSKSTNNQTPIPINQEQSFDFDSLINITVQGTLDESVIPDIKKIANKVLGELNKNITQNRGIRKNAKALGI